MKRISLLCAPVVALLSGFTMYTEPGTKMAIYWCSEALSLDLVLFEYDNGRTYFEFKKDLNPGDAFKKCKLESEHYLVNEYDWDGYFTAFLINSSDTLFTGELQDGSLIMIQEALDRDGTWKPIEYWTNSGCGNSYHNLYLSSGEFVIVPVKAYSGGFKTKLRLKWKTGRGIVYSDAFDGSIDTSQFKKNTETVEGILYWGKADYLDK